MSNFIQFQRCQLQHTDLDLGAGHAPLPRAPRLRVPHARHADPGEPPRRPHGKGLPALSARVEPRQLGPPGKIRMELLGCVRLNTLVTKTER